MGRVGERFITIPCLCGDKKRFVLLSPYWGGAGIAMSIATQRGNTCKYCDTEYGRGFDGQYCSRLCYFKQQGSKLLNLLRHDHRYCSNCGVQLKEVEEPTDAQLRKIDGFHSTQSVVGYQYQTPDADIGQRELGDGPTSRIVQGTICDNCGSADTHVNFPELQDRHLFEYANGILESLEDKSEEHNKEIDRDVFFEMLLETRDLEFSLGKAIE